MVELNSAKPADDAETGTPRTRSESDESSIHGVPQRQDPPVWLNAAAIGLVLFVGVITIAPAFYFRYVSREYRGVELFRSDGEVNYLAQIHEAYDGHPLLGNIYTADGKDQTSFVQQPLPAILLGLPARALNIQPADLNLWTKFFLPFFLTLLAYALFWKLTGRRLYAWVGALVLMTIPASLTLLDPTAWWAAFAHGVFTGKDQFLSFARPVNPQVSSFFVFGFFLLMWKTLFDERPSPNKKFWTGVAAGAIGGLSFYTYFFAYSFVSVFGGLTFLWFFIRKDWVRLKALLPVIVTAAVLAIPFTVNFWHLIHDPLYVEVTRRVGAFASHAFVFSRVWWGAAIVFALAYKKIKPEPLRLFILIFLAASFIVTNQQVLTGRVVPQYSHYHWYYIAPFVAVLLSWLIVWGVKKLPMRLAPIGIAVFVLALGWLAAVYQLRSYQDQKPAVLDEERYADVLRWLDAHTKTDASVFANEDLSSLIVAYTGDNVYYHTNLTDFLEPIARLEHVWFVRQELDGVTDQTVTSTFTRDRDQLGAFVYGQEYRQTKGCYGCFPDAQLAAFIADYQDFFRQDFVAELKKYPIDYLVWDKQKDPLWRVERFIKNKVYDQGPIAVYRF